MVYINVNITRRLVIKLKLLIFSLLLRLLLLYQALVEDSRSDSEHELIIFDSIIEEILHLCTLARADISAAKLNCFQRFLILFKLIQDIFLSLLIFYQSIKVKEHLGSFLAKIFDFLQKSQIRYQITKIDVSFFTYLRS